MDRFRPQHFFQEGSRWAQKSKAITGTPTKERLQKVGLKRPSLKFFPLDAKPNYLTNLRGLFRRHRSHPFSDELTKAFRASTISKISRFRWFASQSQRRKRTRKEESYWVRSWEAETRAGKAKDGCGGLQSRSHFLRRCWRNQKIIMDRIKLNLGTLAHQYWT